MKVAVLGAGMVGRTIARDLARDFEVTAFDLDESNLKLLKDPGISIVQADLSNHGSYHQLLNDFTYVLCAVPGFMGYNCLKKLIELGKHVVDISFHPENSLELDALAREKGVTAIVDCGVAPGMSNLVLGRLDAEMKVTSFTCLVGGLPKIRNKPFEYKAPFSPADVIEEYTRPARYVENGKVIIKPALSDPEYIDFGNIGTLEAFNTDGLRSILFTMNHIPDIKEKTLRYPGHIDLIRSLKLAGFFSREAIDVKGKKIVPLELTCATLFDQWKLQEGEPEFTVMSIHVTGEQEGKTVEVHYDLYDEYDPQTKMSSMSRTTGFTCTAALNLLAGKRFTEPGIFPPELIGSDKNCFDFIMNYLAQRNVIYKRTDMKGSL